MKTPQILVVDDFLADPDAVRTIALAQRFVKMHSAGGTIYQRVTSLSSSGSSRLETTKPAQ